MALQVWLPLTKDLRQQGLIDWNPSLDNGTTASFGTGKLGQALETGGITMPASITKQVLNNEAFSFACWFYVKGTTGSTSERAMIFGNDTMSSLGGRQFSLFQYSTCNDLHWSWQNYKDGSYSSAWGGVLSGVLPSNTWTHIAISYKKGSTTKIYINGIEKYSGTYTSDADSFEFDTKLIWNSAYHKLNDVRLYNHALSPMEVKELAKGLVLHYPLNRGGWGQENLLHNTFDFTGRSASNTTIVTDSTDGTYAKTTPSTVDWTSIQIGPTFAASLISGKTITVTCEVRAFDLPTSTTTNYCYLTLNAFNSASSFSRTGNKDHAYASNVLKEGEWVTLSYQLDVNFSNWTVGSGYTTSDFQYITLGLYNHSGKRIDFRHPKIEVGNKATPWCPNSSDALATTMGLNSLIEYDCSGFCNNGTRTGTFTWTSDTPKYNVSQYFEDYTRYITSPLNGWTPTAITLSCWIKSANKTPRGNWHIPLSLDGQKAEISIGTSGKARIGFTISGTRHVYDWGNSILDNNWHMITNVFDGSSMKMYIDGKLINTHDISGSLQSMNNLYVGRFNGVDTYGNTQLYESDVRIYATALSADDVKSLYQNSAYIDNSGNVYGAVHSEA